MNRALACILAFLFALSDALAEPRDSVVMVRSHGGSATVVATGSGWSLLTSSHHMFRGTDASKPMAFDVPTPAGWQMQRSGTPARLVATDPASDAVLIRTGWGPAPYVAPVAPVGHQAGPCLSVGYDEMKQPPQVRPAQIVGSGGGGGGFTHTRERPWHGRSGGALLSGPYLVGIVSGYTGPRNRAEIHPGANGVYTSLVAVRALLTRAQGYAGSPSPPRVYEQQILPPLVPWCPPGRT